MGTVSVSVVPLSRVDGAEAALIGGKARGFAVLARTGLDAPEGFVVTTAVHREALADSGRIPSGVAGRVRELVAGWGDAPLAVRSSATAEDGGEHSHAGQFLTRLGVRGADEALEAIVDCWESAAAARAVAYRRGRGHDGDVAMAVIVQRLVEADAGGVCMSCDPVTGDAGSVVVNAARGLGELVVSGLVTPDDYRLDRAGRLVGHTPGDAETMLTMGPEGPREIPVPETLRGTPVLDDRLLGEIHAGVLACERALQAPADCEFAVAGGRLTWLQCRPVTALPPS
jgi:phosphoenolpyruvate synthase/pyruvate phosphate dikinase